MSLAPPWGSKGPPSTVHFASSDRANIEPYNSSTNVTLPRNVPPRRNAEIAIPQLWLRSGWLMEGMGPTGCITASQGGLVFFIIEKAFIGTVFSDCMRDDLLEHLWHFIINRDNRTMRMWYSLGTYLIIMKVVPHVDLKWWGLELAYVQSVLAVSSLCYS